MNTAMRFLLMLALIVFVTSSFGQNPDYRRLLGTTINVNPDTALKVLYVNKTYKQKEPAYFLNDKMVNLKFFHSLDPNQIENIHVDDDSLEINNVVYYGQIHIKTKSTYAGQLISLRELKDKYTTIKENPAFFIMDGEVVSKDYDQYVVDENLVSEIIVDKVENKTGNLTFIKLRMKSKQNPEQAEVRIRGGSSEG